MKRPFLYLILMFLFLCCQNKKASKEPIENEKEETAMVIPTVPVTVPFVKGIDIVKPLALSEIASDIEYIPLETNSNSLVRRVFEDLQLTEEFIFFSGGNSGFFQFDRKGSFIRKIARKGQGPGEYTHINSFTINEKDRHIYFLSSGSWKILEYDFEGKHIRDFQAPRDKRGFCRLNDSLFVTFTMNSRGNEEEKLTIFNQEGSIIKTFPQWDRFTVEGNWTGMLAGSSDQYLYTLENKVRHKDFYNDTLFTVTTDSLIPEYVIPLGKYNIPADKRYETIRGDMDLFKSYADSYFRVNIVETSGYIFFPYETWNFMQQQKSRLAVFDKKSGECFTVKDYLIKDDLQHIYPFFPVTYSDNRLIGIVQSSDIIEWEKNGGKWKEHPTLKDIKEDSNPVIVVVTLK